MLWSYIHFLFRALRNGEKTASGYSVFPHPDHSLVYSKGYTMTLSATNNAAPLELMVSNVTEADRIAETPRTCLGVRKNGSSSGMMSPAAALKLSPVARASAETTEHESRFTRAAEGFSDRASLRVWHIAAIDSCGWLVSVGSFSCTFQSGNA